MRIMSRQLVPVGVVIVALALALGSCSSEKADDPRAVVIKLFGAMERNERAAIPNLVDLPALMRIRDQDYALQMDPPRVFYNPEDLLDDLVDSGLTRTRWFSMQRVIGNVEITGDTAQVEVSFINKVSNIQYYNKFGLHKIGGHWRIYSFKTPVAGK